LIACLLARLLSFIIIKENGASNQVSEQVGCLTIFFKQLFEFSILQTNDNTLYYVYLTNKWLNVRIIIVLEFV
jgi:branched-subunit amino acid transport protein AzlD